MRKKNIYKKVPEMKSFLVPQKKWLKFLLQFLFYIYLYINTFNPGLKKLLFSNSI